MPSDPPSFILLIITSFTTLVPCLCSLHLTWSRISGQALALRSSSSPQPSGDIYNSAENYIPLVSNTRSLQNSIRRPKLFPHQRHDSVTVLSLGLSRLGPAGIVCLLEDWTGLTIDHRHGYVFVFLQGEAGCQGAQSQKGEEGPGASQSALQTYPHTRRYRCSDECTTQLEGRSKTSS